MVRRKVVGILAGFFWALCFQGCDVRKQEAETTPDNILLKDFKPISLHKIPVTVIGRAKFPVIDMHTHGRYAKDRSELDDWV